MKNISLSEEQCYVITNICGFFSFKTPLHDKLFLAGRIRYSTLRVNEGTVLEQFFLL